MARRRTWFGYLLTAGLVLITLGGAGAGVVWWKFFKSEPQALADDQARFTYGSLGSELTIGLPYPVFMILPRVFPDLVERYAKQGYGPNKPGWGGYTAFGLAWEPGHRLPAGLSIKRVGYERVTANCALCHTATYRLSADSQPTFVTGGPGHTVNIQALLRFLFAAAHDQRFTAARLLPEIAVHFPLDWLDWQIYSFIVIPELRAKLLLAEHELGWMEHKPAWGPGRDDAFNLPKFILMQRHWDDSVSNTDFPALWRMEERDRTLLHAGGEAKTVYAVTATSAFGAGAPPSVEFRHRNEWIVGFLRKLPAPKYPVAIDPVLAERGAKLYAAECASCHSGGGTRTGTVIPVAEIGTDPAHVRAWTDADARRMNTLTGTLRMDGAELQAATGYVAKPLIGVWLLGPYLHNGSVPTLDALLMPPAQRPNVFWRGYDVLDQERLGFVSTGPAAEANGFRYDTKLPGNGNGGHTYGIGLAPADRRDLIEYLKTL